ncbi:folate-sensitive fragile site protein Fra10Ac1-domain-containing protein [Rhodofomes roseus]|uniref:Folate-sensitive fragile site protein Fra10Ac1-domain-containing protein n=1 Tax=Rhodofomes roseus TaxID=34475 RepID=A0ABQ8K3W2_9APHY|nr:folate-sensitive fragile site protein Fra10Ac1-domain-containing protein [Rhodofomes roseus]KAH9831577.1 folate-sensitive fragile site protein Fra10Ac1-domain-containing protein [Rhodofomes roseus]
MSLYQASSSSKQVTRTGLSEFDILKASHKFLREDGETDEAKLSWDDKLAKKYYENLYREYAVCDLKHYKSGNFALRWRTESEVISGAGDTTCGNTRCPLHEQRAVNELRPSLKTLELPFSYVEDGEGKFALVKVVLCDKCLKKLMWTRSKEKDVEKTVQGNGKVKVEEQEERVPKEASHGKQSERKLRGEDREHTRPSQPSKHRSSGDETHRRRRESRSRSPLPSRGKARPRPD